MRKLIIIPCLDVKDGRVVKRVHFREDINTASEAVSETEGASS
jgi:imidazole glycerol phosphate synthase subunit HisF